MQRMTLIARGFPLVIEPHTMFENQGRIYYGPFELGRLVDDSLGRSSVLECLFDTSIQAIRVTGRREERIGTACDRMVALLQQMAQDRHTPPTLDTVGDEDED